MRVDLIDDPTENVITLKASFSGVTWHDPNVTWKSNLTSELRVVRIALKPWAVVDARKDITEQNLLGLLL